MMKNRWDWRRKGVAIWEMVDGLLWDLVWAQSSNLFLHEEMRVKTAYEVAKVRACDYGSPPVLFSSAADPTILNTIHTY